MNFRDKKMSISSAIRYRPHHTFRNQNVTDRHTDEKCENSIPTTNAVCVGVVGREGTLGAVARDIITVIIIMCLRNYFNLVRQLSWK